MSSAAPNLLSLFAGFVGLSILVFAFVTMTSFVKLSTIMLILRNALGTQQAPPNLVIYGIALMLTLYITTPVIDKAYQAVVSTGDKYETLADYRGALERASVPISTFMERFTEPGERQFFANATQQVWGQDSGLTASPDDFVVLVPAFLLSELRRAFEAGLLLYLPFIAIDLVITSVLMAMGMQSVSPTTLSVPFKLFLFVALQGWARLFHGLVLGYAV